MSTPPHGAPPPPPADTPSHYHVPEFSRAPKSRIRAVPIIVSGLIGLGIGVAGTLGAVALTTGLGTDDESVAEDRKSTRLNSSHVAISYAVFCLKKKRCSDA